MFSHTTRFGQEDPRDSTGVVVLRNELCFTEQHFSNKNMSVSCLESAPFNQGGYNTLTHPLETRWGVMTSEPDTGHWAGAFPNIHGESNHCFKKDKSHILQKRKTVKYTEHMTKAYRQAVFKLSNKFNIEPQRNYGHTWNNMKSTLKTYSRLTRRN